MRASALFVKNDTREKCKGKRLMDHKKVSDPRQNQNHAETTPFPHLNVDIRRFKAAKPPARGLAKVQRCQKLRMLT